MGARGPAKEPAERKQMRGTAQPHRDPAPVIERYGMPANPFRVEFAQDEHQAYEWIVKHMADAGAHAWVAPSDFGALESAAIALARARQATREASALEPGTGPGCRYVTTKANGILPHPALKLEESAWSRWRAYAADLGLSPSARNNVTAAKGTGSTSGNDDPVIGALLHLVPKSLDDLPAEPEAKPARPRAKAPAKKRATAKPKPKPKPKAATNRRRPPAK